MIRPITCVGFLMACVSGLYLYQAKHRVNLIDQQIEKTVHQTDTAREQIRLLHAEWTLLNQPDRLQKLAGQFLSLQPTNPAQFTSMAELDNRLPPIPPEPPPAQPEANPRSVPVAEAAPPQAAESPPASAPVATAAAPSKPEQAPKPEQATIPKPEQVAARPAAPRPVEHPHPLPEPKPYHPVELAAAPHPTPTVLRVHVIPAAAPRPYWQRSPLPQTVPAPAYPATPAAIGSLLGMAQPRPGTIGPPPPVPMTGWANGN